MLDSKMILKDEKTKPAKCYTLITFWNDALPLHNPLKWFTCLSERAMVIVNRTKSMLRLVCVWKQRDKYGISLLANPVWFFSFIRIGFISVGIKTIWHNEYTYVQREREGARKIDVISIYVSYVCARMGV